MIEISVEPVKTLIEQSLRKSALGPIIDEYGDMIHGGKMLRARMTLEVGSAAGGDPDTLERAAAAVEMLHAASLLHDDVIDGADLRRGAPTFWKERGISGAILLGDVLVCRAIELVHDHLKKPLVRFAGDMCSAEAEQELLLRGTTPNWDTCLSIARRKTGALFAFAAYSCGGADPKLSETLEEAGYRLGTAYQLADDVLDANGDDGDAGKTLGTDAARQKITAASAAAASGGDPLEFVRELTDSSAAVLEPWPEVQAAWQRYIAHWLQPAMDRLTASSFSALKA